LIPASLRLRGAILPFHGLRASCFALCASQDKRLPVAIRLLHLRCSRSRLLWIPTHRCAHAGLYVFFPPRIAALTRGYSSIPRAALRLPVAIRLLSPTHRCAHAGLFFFCTYGAVEQDCIWIPTYRCAHAGLYVFCIYDAADQDCIWIPTHRCAHAGLYVFFPPRIAALTRGYSSSAPAVQSIKSEFLPMLRRCASGTGLCVLCTYGAVDQDCIWIPTWRPRLAENKLISRFRVGA
jgi:hypothetical protein